MSSFISVLHTECDVPGVVAGEKSEAAAAE